MGTVTLSFTRAETDKFERTAKLRRRKFEPGSALPTIIAMMLMKENLGSCWSEDDGGDAVLIKCSLVKEPEGLERIRVQLYDYGHRLPLKIVTK